MGRVVVRSGDGYRQEVTAGAHSFVVDEPREAGGTDTGPDPYQLLLAALGSCTSITVQMYAKRKGWPLRAVRVELEHERVHARDCDDCEATDGYVDRIRKHIYLGGPLSDEQVAALSMVARRCPVNLTLTREVIIEDSAHLLPDR